MKMRTETEEEVINVRSSRIVNETLRENEQKSRNRRRKQNRCGEKRIHVTGNDLTRIRG